MLTTPPYVEDLVLLDDVQTYMLSTMRDQIESLGAQRVIYNWIRPHFFHGKTPEQSIRWIAEEITFEDFVRI